jgi:DedD protein
MRTAVEREHEEVDSEITLSATTLLGIFFGLVLVCGVFFGFGYSTGRRGSEAANANTTAASTLPSSETPPASHTPKPSAMEPLKAASTSAPDPNIISESPDEDFTAEGTTGQPPAPAAKPAALAPVPVSKPSAVAPAAKPASLPVAVGNGSFMVQIAAVTRSEDANALASALRQRGYTVAVRNEPQDTLLHVQLGPFATRDDAKAMRSKLLADGYNAILKP